LKNNFAIERVFSLGVVIIISLLIYYKMDYNLKVSIISSGTVTIKSRWHPLIIHIIVTFLSIAALQFYHKTCKEYISALWKSKFFDNFFYPSDHRKFSKYWDIDQKRTIYFIPALCAIVALLYIVTISSIFPIHYHANDDLAIESFLSTGNDPVFLSILAGKFIQFLYSLNQNIGFYSLTLLFVQWISLSVLIYCFVVFIKKTNLSRILVILFAIASLLLFTHLIISLTFTTTAFIIGFAGVVLFVNNFINGKGRNFPFFVSGILLSISYLIRPIAVNGVLLFSLPILVWVVVTHFKGNIRTVFFSMLLMFLPLLITRYSEKFTYKYGTSDEFKSFRKFNAVRGRIHDNPAVYKILENQDLFDLNGWTQNDFLLLLNWYFAHEDKYNIKTLSNVVKAYPESSKTSMLVELIPNIPSLSAYLWERYLLNFLLFLCVIAFSFRKGELIISVLLLLYLFYVFGAILFLSHFYLVKDRIFDPVLLGTSTISIFILNPSTSIREYFPRNLVILKVAILAFLIISIISEKFTDTLNFRDIYSKRQKLKQIIENYNNRFDGYIILSRSGSSGLDFVTKNPFKPKDYHLKPFFIGGGWTTFSPYYYKRLERGLGIKAGKDILPAFINNPKAIVIGPKEFISILKTFIFETYLLEVEFINLSEFGENYYMLVSAD
jgi:hypothetical protein